MVLFPFPSGKSTDCEQTEVSYRTESVPKMLKGRLAHFWEYGQKVVLVSKQEPRTGQRQIRRERRRDAGRKQETDSSRNYRTPLKSRSLGNRMSDSTANNGHVGCTSAEGLIQCQALFHNAGGSSRVLF